MRRCAGGVRRQINKRLRALLQIVFRANARAKKGQAKAFRTAPCLPETQKCPSSYYVGHLITQNTWILPNAPGEKKSKHSLRDLLFRMFKYPRADWYPKKEGSPREACIHAGALYRGMLTSRVRLHQRLAKPRCLMLRPLYPSMPRGPRS